MGDMTGLHGTVDVVVLNDELEKFFLGFVMIDSGVSPGIR